MTTIQLVRLLDKKMSVEQAGFFAQMILNPASYVQRIGETITPSTRSYGVTSTYSISVPASLDGLPVVIPLFLARKTVLLSRFSVENSSGYRYSTLSQDDAIAHTATVLRKLISPVGAKELAAYEATLEEPVVKFLCRSDPVPDHDGEYATLRTAILALSNTNSVPLDLVVRLLRTFRRQYPLVIIESGAVFGKGADHHSGHARIRVRVTRRAIPHLHTRSTIGDRLRDAARLTLGVRPSLISWPISNSLRAESYHLETVGPEGTYLAKQAVVDIDNPDDLSPLAGVQYRMEPRFWQRYSHLYVHGRSEDPPRNLAYLAKFYERAPGSMAPATLSAFAAVFLIAVAGISRSTLKLEPQGSDIVAVLLAVPVVAGAWAGFERSSSVFGGALNSRICLIATMVLSLTASGYYILGPRPTTEEHFKLSWLDRPGVAMWVMLALLALMNFVAAVLSWALRANVQSYFTNREGKDMESA